MSGFALKARFLPARRLLFLGCLGHALALMVVLAFPPPGYWQFFPLLPLFLSLGVFLGRYRRRRGLPPCWAVILDERGGLRLLFSAQPGEGPVEAGSASDVWVSVTADQVVLLPWLVSVRLQPLELPPADLAARFPLRLVLLGDELPADDLRRLRVQLRWRRIAAPAGTGGQ